MKQRERIAMNILNPGSCIYTSRNEWSLEIIREPRPSCVPAWKVRNQLRELPPGETTTINGLLVKRKALTHVAAKYVIDGRWYRIDAAIEVIEGIREEKSA